MATESPEERIARIRQNRARRAREAELVDQWRGVAADRWMKKYGGQSPSTGELEELADMKQAAALRALETSQKKPDATDSYLRHAARDGARDYQYEQTNAVQGPARSIRRLLEEAPHDYRLKPTEPWGHHTTPEKTLFEEEPEPEHGHRRTMAEYGHAGEGPEPALLDLLDEDERELAKLHWLLAEPYSVKELAEKEGVSESTIHRRLRRIRAKLGASGTPRPL